MKQNIFFVILCFITSFNFLIAEPYGTKKPRVSIITSLYNGDEFIVGFLEDQVKQINFDDYELIIINANSPGNEEPIIKEYVKRYPNIVYVRLDHDPGLYAVWNMGIKMARADFVTNANVDDRRNPEIVKKHVEALEQDASVDLVYSDYKVTETPNETFEKTTARYVVLPCEFSPNRMHKCLPGPQPMWRKSMHVKYGYFDETFKSAGDFEMWNRAVSKGARFKRVPGESGLFYVNPRGLSTDVTKKEMQDAESHRVSRMYSRVWSTHYQYFCTAADSNAFSKLLNLIGSIQNSEFDELGGIAVFDLGLTDEQRAFLTTIEKVSVHKLAVTNPDLLKHFKANNQGWTIQGWGAWKFVALKQALDIFPYALWVDPDFTVLKSLRVLFAHIQETGYFLCTIGDEKFDGKCSHPVRWGATGYVRNALKLEESERNYLLDKEPLLSGVIGFSRQAVDYLVDPLYTYTNDLKLFEDDGTASQGFGSARAEETVLSIFAYLHGLTVHQQDFTQKKPLLLYGQGSYHELFLTWNKGYVNEKTDLYHSRSDLGSYERYVKALHRTNNEPMRESPKKAKIVGLVPARNEVRFLYQHLKALSMYVDAIVYLDDVSDDNSVQVVESIAAECKVEKIIKKDRWIRDEPGDRNALLQAGRQIGGTHFVVLDADEMFTANCLEKDLLRNLILTLEPGDKLCFVWIQLWRSVKEYRFDDSVWTWNYKDFVFCDDGKCSYVSDFLNTPRTPRDLNGNVRFVKGYDYGVLHFQFVNWRNLLVKQAWYRCLEHIRNPAKSIKEINELYGPSKDESNLRTAQAPAWWFANYTFLDLSVYQQPEGWKEKEVLSWFAQYGKNFFEELDIWDIDWEIYKMAS
jgi:glycosyltransferase involved in cell wall biosynthesis